MGRDKFHPEIRTYPTEVNFLNVIKCNLNLYLRAELSQVRREKPERFPLFCFFLPFLLQADTLLHKINLYLPQKLHEKFSIPLLPSSPTGNIVGF